jgi:hypothetical protein
VPPVIIPHIIGHTLLIPLSDADVDVVVFPYRSAAPWHLPDVLVLAEVDSTPRHGCYLMLRTFSAVSCGLVGGVKQIMADLAEAKRWRFGAVRRKMADQMAS